MPKLDHIKLNFTQSLRDTKYGQALRIRKQPDTFSFFAQDALGSEFWDMVAMISGNLAS